MRVWAAKEPAVSSDTGVPLRGSAVPRIPDRNSSGPARTSAEIWPMP